MTREEEELLCRAVEGGLFDDELLGPEDGNWWPTYARDVNDKASAFFGRQIEVLHEDWCREATKQVRPAATAISRRLRVLGVK